MKHILLTAVIAVIALVATSCCNEKSNCKSTITDNSDTMTMIRLNVYYTVANEANRAEAVEVAKKLVEASRLDAGCVSYDFLESATMPGEYMIVETWENDSVLNIHSNAPHFTEYVPQLQALGVMKTDRFTLE